ncbi:hypothetical protein pb186bvf_010781 [Paramecium bursaria]
MILYSPQPRIPNIKFIQMQIKQLIDTKPYFVTNSAKTKRIQTAQHTQSNYETLLSTVYTRSPSKTTKGSPFMSDKIYINQLIAQNQLLKEEVRKLTKENQQLKASQDKTLNKIKQQYTQMTKYNNLLKQVQIVKLENSSLKENLTQIQRDIQIQFQPLQKIIKHFMQEPKQCILDILNLRNEQLLEEIGMYKQKSELLNIERGELLDMNLSQYNKIEELLKKNQR